jgi:hypothetical protein
MPVHLHFFAVLEIRKNMKLVASILSIELREILLAFLI